MSPDESASDPPQIRIWTRAIILTVVIELFTIAMRYVLGLQSTRDSASIIGPWTFGLRIHHGYVGILLLIGAFLVRDRAAKLARNLIVWGAALVLSDAIHHFLVLWPIEGSPEFDIWYRTSPGR